MPRADNTDFLSLVQVLSVHIPDMGTGVTDGKSE
jgi:hypothetical protein